MERVAVYSGTRNLYPDMETAAKSLIANSNVDEVHLLIEDDEFPFKVPDIVTYRNVKGQKWFNSKTCANWNTHFTYMSLLRVCYTYLFPDLKRILQLDVDTIVTNDISPIWDIEMGGSLFAAVPENLSSYKPYGDEYYNIGVALFNLQGIKAHGMDEKLVEFLNNKTVKYIDQDAWNWFEASRATRLDVKYNESRVTGYTDNPAIVHYAGFKNWQKNQKVPRREYIRQYKNMSWEEALERHADH